MRRNYWWLKTKIKMIERIKYIFIALILKYNKSLDIKMNYNNNLI